MKKEKPIKFKYAKNGRLKFTKQMKKSYTLLFPMMAPIHFTILQRVFNHYGYHAELLTDSSPAIAQTGLKYIQNDMCYPAILSCGQMIHALQSGKYDLHHVALMISQTGGGCRASNYISLLRKGLKRAGLDYVPCVSINLSGLEKNSGLQITLGMIRRMTAAVIYGDMLMVLKNQVEPYEVEKGTCKKLVDKWTEDLCNQILNKNGYKSKIIQSNLNNIAKDFGSVKRDGKPRVKVGIVGEIYVKYAALGNNNLEKFLRDQDCEVNLPGMMNFILFKVDNRLEDIKLYGGHKMKKLICQILFNFCTKMQNMFNDAIRNNTNLQVPSPYQHVKALDKGINGYGNKMGEGWLLTGEMLELCESGYENIVCTQPFGCLPNHISGKGMIRKVREVNPGSNIVAVDYDAGAPKVNQENRIKLMLSIAKENLDKEEAHKTNSATKSLVK
jgi:predicted nucleotide-binding protein (sugar kinase/HSP70/actin superfamily)